MKSKTDSDGGTTAEASGPSCTGAKNKPNKKTNKTIMAVREICWMESFARFGHYFQ